MPLPMKDLTPVCMEDSCALSSLVNQLRDPEKELE